MLKFEDLPTHSDSKIMGRDVAQRCQTNHAELFARMLHRLSMYTPRLVAERLSAAVDAIQSHLPYTIESRWLDTPVEFNEAYRSGLAGIKTPLPSTLTLHALLTAAEQELGQDHADVLPIRWYRRGLADRTRQMLEETENAHDTHK